jgi:hypothetical protein
MCLILSKFYPIRQQNLEEKKSTIKKKKTRKKKQKSEKYQCKSSGIQSDYPSECDDADDEIWNQWLASFYSSKFIIKQNVNFKLKRNQRLR